MFPGRVPVLRPVHRAGSQIPNTKMFQFYTFLFFVPGPRAGGIAAETHTGLREMSRSIVWSACRGVAASRGGKMQDRLFRTCFTDFLVLTNSVKCQG